MPDFDITDDPASSDITFLDSEMAQYVIENSSKPHDKKPFGIFKRDEDQKIMAGLTGATFWSLLYIDNLWVNKRQRRNGIGSALMQAAEQKGRERGCHSAYLWTESFETPAFYQKLGYQKFVVMEDVPSGHQRIGFMKRLAA